MTTTDRFDPLPPGIALGFLGIGVAAVTFASLGAENVSFARTEWTARLAMMLAAPAIVIYVAGTGSPGRWWRAFWTAGMLAYLMHVWWAVARAYGGDFGAIVERQGWVAGTNALATLLWIADVVAAWVIASPRNLAVQVLRFLAWTIVTISFIVASAVFRSGTSAVFGYVLAALVAGALLTRWMAPRPA